MIEPGICRGPTGSDGPTGPAGVDALSVNRIDAGNIGGSQLVAVDTSTMADGTIATVFSVGALFRLVKSPTAALIASVNGITVVASTASPGSIWVRLIATTDERFAANPPLFIDPASGNDDNDGLLVGTALKTGDEWCRRTAGVTFSASFTLTIAAGDMGSFTPSFKTAQAKSVVVSIAGNVTSSAAGTIGAFVTQNPAAAANADGTRSEFTDGGAPAIGTQSRLRITASGTPSHVGLIAFVTSYHTGATNPYTTRWVTGGSDPAFTAAAINPSNGDSYVVDTLNTVCRVIDLSEVVLGTVGEMRFIDLDVHSLDVVQGFHRVYGNMQAWDAKTICFYRCKFSDQVGTGFVDSIATFTACDFTQPVVMSMSNGIFYGCCFRLGFGNFQGVVAFRLSNTFNNYPTAHPIAYFSHAPAQGSNNGEIQFCNCGGATGIAISIGNGSGWDESGTLWGAGNTLSVGISINGRAQMTYVVAANVNVPATIPIRVSGLPYTQANLPIADLTTFAGVVLG